MDLHITTEICVNQVEAFQRNPARDRSKPARQLAVTVRSTLEVAGRPRTCRDFPSAGYLSDAGSESSGIAAARRHTNNNDMAVHVPAISRSRFSIVISLEWTAGKSYAAIGDISIRNGSISGDIALCAAQKVGR